MCNHDGAFNIVRTKDNHMITDVICADCNESLMDIIAEQKEAIEKQVPLVELGKLALTTRATVCSNKDFIKNRVRTCEKHCTNYQFCARRAKSLAEVPKCST